MIEYFNSMIKVFYNKVNLFLFLYVRLCVVYTISKNKYDNLKIVLDRTLDLVSTLKMSKCQNL